MFCIKRETDYAVQLIRFLQEKKGECRSLREFANESGISFWFLQKIARRLNLAGVIVAEQGLNGGYKLNGSAKNLTMLMVMQIMEGKVGTTLCMRCDADKLDCAGQGKSTCRFKGISQKLNREIIKVLQGMRVAV